MTKYFFITGGVFSSLGKGLCGASIALLLESRGYKVGMLKLDPYLNVDPGTMNPFQHGEVYVTDDGAETDLDLGHYHRFTNAVLSKFTNATSGQIYDTVIKKERKGEYLGNTVQVIPHITDEIKQRIKAAKHSSKDPDLLFIEIGGTVGDIESLPFLEAMRQLRLEHPRDCVNIHITYVPHLSAAGELKTKPTQHSVQMLRSIGIIPDVIICRSENPLSKEIKEKIALFCSVSKEHVFDAPDVKKSIYEIPFLLKESGIDTALCTLAALEPKKSNFKAWETLIDRIYAEKKPIVIGIVGKYLQHKDAYKSIFEALTHAALEAHAELIIKHFDAEKMTGETLKSKEFLSCEGFLVPGGFGLRGWEGKILTANYSRTHKVPYFGICLGMQVMAVEFARSVCHLENANSTEMDPETSHPIISLLSEQKNIPDLGGTMRLGAYSCKIDPTSKAYNIYQSSQISERHRHRYEFNSAYSLDFNAKGCAITGVEAQSGLCEILEITDHPWMIGVQFHPEFKSKPTSPHPLFKNFIEAILQRSSL